MSKWTKKRYSVDNGLEKEAALVCLTCTLPPCEGIRKGCAYDKQFGRAFAAPRVSRDYVGYREPLVRDL